ncbi:MAG TPA: hypothetical protein VF111_09565, partial [Thermoanaerobaculia bacterium]
MRIAACLERKAPKASTGTPERLLASALARYAIRLADDDTEGARRALDEAVRLHAQLTDESQRGRSAVELQSSIAIEASAEERPAREASVAQEAKQFAARLDGAAQVDDDALLALVHLQANAEEGATPVALESLVSRFSSALDSLRRDLAAASRGQEEDFTRFSRRATLLLLVERAFLHLYVRHGMLDLSQADAPLRADDPLVRMFGRLSDFGRRNLLAINDAVGNNFKESGAFPDAVRMHEGTLALLQSLPDGAMPLRDEMTAYAGFQIAHMEISLGRPERARKALEQSAPAIARIPA